MPILSDRISDIKQKIMIDKYKELKTKPKKMSKGCSIAFYMFLFLLVILLVVAYFIYKNQ